MGKAGCLNLNTQLTDSILNITSLAMIQLKQTSTYMKWERKLKDQTAKALIAARLLRLVNGLLGDVRSIGNGLSELRIHYGPGYRIYFQQRGSTIVVLLCAGDKSTQEKDIARAKQIAVEWREDDGRENF